MKFLILAAALLAARPAPAQPAAAPCAETLAPKIISPDDAAREEAIDAVTALDDAAKDKVAACLTEYLKTEKDASNRRLIMAVLWTTERAKPAAQVIMSAFFAAKDSDELTTAAGVLAGMAGELKDYAPRFAEALKTNKDENIRSSSALILGRMGPGAGKQVLALKEALSDDNPRVRACAAAALALAAPSKDIPARELVRLYGLDEKLAAEAIMSVYPDQPQRIAVLAAALKDEEPEIRLHAAEWLGGFGEAAKDAVPALFNMLSDANKEAGYAAAGALGRIGAPAIASLSGCIEKDYSVDPAPGCVLAYAWMGDAAVDPLKKELKNKNASSRRNACRALGAMAGHLLMPQANLFYDDPEGAFFKLKSAIPNLQAAAESDADQKTRELARAALSEIAKGFEDMPAQNQDEDKAE